MSDEGRERAIAVLRGTPLIDGHNDLPWAMRVGAQYDFATWDPCGPLPHTHTDIPRLRTGLVGAQFWSVYVPSTLPGPEAVVATLEQIDFVYELVNRAPDHLEMAFTADDVERVFASGKVASLLGAEGGHSIACSMGALRALYGLGVRYMTLTHNDNNPWADSATDAPGVGGLSEFGREVVREMNRLGMLVDLSHVADSTMNAALDTSEAPVIFSHSSARAVTDHPRNVPDDVLARLAANGGVCMVAFVPDFVSRECREWRVAMRADMEAKGYDSSDLGAWRTAADQFSKTNPRPVATLAQVADHMDHVRQVVGVEHVGVGGDYDGVDKLPDGLVDVSCYPALFEELLARGWSEADCAHAAGANVLRVMREAESVSARLRGERSASVARYES